MVLLPLVLALALALAHLSAGRMRFLDRVPRSRWLSVAGGISVSYVFLQLLPELARGSQEVADVLQGGVEDPGHLLALLGLAVFYGVERSAHTSRRRRQQRGEADEAGASVAWLSFATYAVYNAIIGYVLVREQRTVASLVLFAVAMGVHFIVNDHGLRAHHRRAYHTVGRWLVASTIMLGAALGLATKVHGAVIGALVGFIAGGIVLNVIKEELPKERESSFPAFLAGALAYAALLLLV